LFILGRVQDVKTVTDRVSKELTMSKASKVTRDRRDFLRASAALGGAAACYYVNPVAAKEPRSPNEKLNIAAIGTYNRAKADIKGCADENIVALVDIDSKFLDAAGNDYPAARKYRDFRIMLEKEADNIDAVIVGTPDHTHAPAAAMALRLGKHVYCEKPLTHTVYEARKLAQLAAEKKLVTQMGTQIHAGHNYRRVVELIESGAIGQVREVHVWVGVTYDGGKLHKASKPANVDWDLWLGPAPEREYVNCTLHGEAQSVHPFHWRRFWDYGTGGLGDFGCHYMDLPHWALKLRNPTKVSAQGPAPLAEATTAGLVVKYEYPQRGKLPPVNLTWYDGGKKPAQLAQYKGGSGKALDWGSGQLFVGEKGAVISNYGTHLLLPKNDIDDLKRPEPYIPDSIGHHKEWTNAIKTGGTTTCNFDYSGALTESVLLGVASYRSGQDLVWDSEKLQVTNSAEAQQLIHKEYRKGWQL